MYVAPKWRAELPTTTNEEDSDDGEARQNRGLLLCGIYERKRDADAAADGVGELILRMFRGTDSRDDPGPGAFPAGRDLGSCAASYARGRH